ncbi:MAG TPA: Ig-like domain-containing protein [Gemmatimonadales bacterium]|nr:Ig-like domain-containing protein [Gemmatimonadales bacterium]
MPPRIVSVRPESGAVIPNWKDEISIQFDEVIDEMAGGGATTGLQQQVLLSPVRGTVKVSWHRSRVAVEPREGWKHRVYRLEILPGFVDLHRNRLDTAKTVIFSTGPEIGHARIGGIVLQWIEQRFQPKALIEAVPLPDSSGYLTLADSGGQFNLSNLNPGRYIVYAVLDENGDRRRGPREAYDSVVVTLDSSANVALYTFPHDTTPPRLRSATYLDSTTARVEFSQALDPTVKLDTAHVHVLELPDSTPFPVARVFTAREFDSVATAERARADSLRQLQDTTARDTTQRAGRPTRPQIHPAVPPAAPPPPPPPPPLPSPAGRGRRQPPKGPPVDTALVRRLLGMRPIPSDKFIVRMARPLKPETRYVVRVIDATNLIGKKGSGEVSFSVPKPAPPDTTHRAPGGRVPADTTRRAPRPPTPPPPPPPPPPLR